MLFRSSFYLGRAGIEWRSHSSVSHGCHGCCYHNLPVKLVGVGGGVNYSTLGSTHHASEDVAIMSALPNMTVLAPCDPAEAATIAKLQAQLHANHPEKVTGGKAKGKE